MQCVDDAATQELVARAARQDRAAIEQLLVRHLPGLEAFVRLRLGAALRARLQVPDLVQSVCREVLEDLTGFEFRGEAPFKHWLFVRAENKLREKHRYHAADRRHRDHEVPLPDGSTFLPAYAQICSPSRDCAVQEAVVRFESAFDLLPADHQEAITLHKLVGLSHAEIAARMGRSEGAVRNLVYRGISRLALLVDQGGGDTTVRD